MYLEQCNENQLKQIYEEFGVTEKSLKRDVNYLMEWLEKQPHLPNVRDEEYIANILLRCKNSLESAKTKLDLRYTARCLLPKMYSYRNPCDEQVKKALHAGCFFMPLPKLTKEGDRIHVFRIFDKDKVNAMTVDEYLKIQAIRSDISLKADKCRQFTFIIDFAKISVTFLTMFSQMIKKISAVSTEIEVMRISKIIIVNMNPKFQYFLNFAKNILSKKITSKFEIWEKEPKDLVDILPKNVLPSIYGGDEKSLEELAGEYYKYTTEFRDWLLAQDDFKADVSKRIDDLYKNFSVHGTEGSFRELSID